MTGLLLGAWAGFAVAIYQAVAPPPRFQIRCSDCGRTFTSRVLAILHALTVGRL